VVKAIYPGGPQLPACKNDDFYWPLALAVTKNATINRFTTATIELLCTSGALLFVCVCGVAAIVLLCTFLLPSLLRI
jgi:hypothetical protein